MCGSRKYPYSPHGRDWKFLGGGGFSKTQKFKEIWVWIFNGTAQSPFL